MIGSPQPTGAAEPGEPDAPSDSSSAQQSQPRRLGPRWFAAKHRSFQMGWLACGFAAGLVIVWVVAFSGREAGSKAEWLSGAGVFGAVAVAMWQTIYIQRKANQDAAEAAGRLRMELAAAEARSVEELAHARELHRAEMKAQRELARMQRRYLLAQQQKQAVIDVSRAVSAHTHMLATLWNQGASILRIEDRDEREHAMNPIFEQIGQVVNDFSVELANAHLLVEDDRLHAALNRVNEAVLMALQVAEDVHVAVADGRALQPNPIPPLQRLMHRRAAEARHLAWDLLRTGLDNA